MARDDVDPELAGLSALASLPGLGQVSARWLTIAGVPDPATLVDLGAVAAFDRVVRSRPQPPSLNLLYALEGAISGRDWREVARRDGATLRLAWEDYRTGADAWHDPDR